MEMNQCPECKGNRVTCINENMLCLTCGYQEFLYDYPNAFDNGPELPDVPRLEKPLAIQKVVHYHRHITVPRKELDQYTII